MVIAVTRPENKVEETKELLKGKGIEGIVIPVFKIEPIPVPDHIKLDDFDWLVVTSATGAEIAIERFQDELNEVSIAVVGPKTDEAFKKRGFKTDFVSLKHTGADLAKELSPFVKGKDVLVARADEARQGLIEIMADVSNVKVLPLYHSKPSYVSPELRRFRYLLEKKGIDALIVTSSKAARVIGKALGKDQSHLLEDVLLVGIGPITAETMRELGLEVGLVSKISVIDSCLDEVIQKIKNNH